MRRSLFVILATILVGGVLPAQAQEEPTNNFRKNEFYIGYSYLMNGVGRIDNEIAHGWSLSHSHNFNRWIGMTTDFGGEYGKARQLAQALFRVYPSLFGPRFTVRSRHTTLFAHTMFGFAITRTNAFIDPILGPEPPDVRVDFAMGFGGGTDVTFGWLGLRLVQFDHIPIRTENGWVKNNRVRSGLLLRWGR